LNGKIAKKHTRTPTNTQTILLNKIKTFKHTPQHRSTPNAPPNERLLHRKL